MKARVTSFKAVLLAVLSAVLFGFFLVPHGASSGNRELQAQLMALKRELHRKAILCGKENQECVSVCMNAITTAFKKKNVAVAQPLIDQCKELADPVEKAIAAKNAAALDNTVLKEGFAWMPDVDAIVGQGGGRSQRLLAQDRKDFHEHCRTELYRYVSPEQKKVAPIGSRVRLKFVQYNLDTRGLCRVGEVEILK